MFIAGYTLLGHLPSTYVAEGQGHFSLVHHGTSGVQKLLRIQSAFAKASQCPNKFGTKSTAQKLLHLSSTGHGTKKQLFSLVLGKINFYSFYFSLLNTHFG